MSEENGNVDRHGRVMEAIGGLRASLSAHVEDQNLKQAEMAKKLAVITAHVERLEAALTAGTILAKALRFTWPLLVGMVGALWWLSDHWHRLFPPGGPAR